MDERRAAARGLSRRTALKLLGAGGLSTLGVSATVGNAAGQQGSGGAIGPTLIDRNEARGFNFPYYLYSPENAREKPLLVETVNSGGCDDDFQADLDAAERTVSGGVARQISDELRVPLIVPVFANPCEGEFWNRFIQLLDTETMHIDSGRFERIDLQLLEMVEDARQRLESQGIAVPDEIMLNGFSASGNFVNNFTVLHPERVASVTGGAINGMATLPREEAVGRTVNYQIGVADLEALTGSAFDEETWRDVPQFYYMGAEETPPGDDTLPYRDVWSEEQAQTARAVYGDNMQAERMVYSEAVYHQAEAESRFEVYDGIGHTYSDATVADVISFHRRHNEIESISPTGTPAAGMESLSLDVFVASDTGERLVARAFVDGSDVTADPGTVVPNVGTEVTVGLAEPIEIDDQITVGVFEQGDQPLSEAIITYEGVVEAEAQFTSEPAPGDTEIEVSYGLSATADGTAYLSVVPDGSSVYWERRVNLESVTPGESGTDTYRLETENEGVPFESGDEVELWLIPGGNQVPERAIAIDTVTIGETDQGNSEAGFAGERLEASSCGDDLDHDEVAVGFDRRPTVGDDTVRIEYDIEDSFDQRVRVRLFPETGGGSWGEGLDWISSGESGSREYDVPSEFLPLGDRVEVRAFPGDWRTLDDVIATECAVVSGVVLDGDPQAGDSEITVEYSYPSTVSGDGTLELLVGESVVASVDSISPGTVDRRAFDIEPIPHDTDVSIRLVTPDGERIDTVGFSTRPEGVASVDVVEAPMPYERSLSLEYELSSEYEIDRFCTVRLYNASSSSWGILLERLEPGDSATATIQISTDEPGVPFAADDEFEIALVDWDDPYATRPLATTSRTVGEQVDGRDPDGSDGPGPIDDSMAEPRDVDGDGLYEDVNGDGEVDASDTLDYYENRDADPIQDHPEAFDFDGDGVPGTVSDALEHYEMID